LKLNAGDLVEEGIFVMYDDVVMKLAGQTCDMLTLVVSDYVNRILYVFVCVC